MTKIITTLIIVCLILANYVFAESDSEFTCKGMNKKQLCNFFMDMPVACKKRGNNEWITFDDWTSKKKGDVVIFHLKNDVVISYEKPK
ncbi:MAG: hypothetical protein ISS92_02855 [Candidatus Omnitrophica bacterium]|nr:hypothetical protein [Candidatus Omnitrophota bacterium]